MLHHIKPADALQMATCLESGATLFLTNEHRLANLRRLQVVQLDDYA